ncbi:class I SAM-dependent methyltransferase [Candidatus Kaiserbacteria bacterium]|nr:class I SAM-dependent methyltransferase [Candidatus Kaiserbacteria bacterium]
MIERSHTHNREAAEAAGNRYLSNLGLSWGELQGKRILDVGAMSAEFENAARRRGINVISLDKGLDDGEYAPPTDSRFVVANATKLPFKDESFDYALAHMSVMNYIENGYEEKYLNYVEDALREACRVLKPDGQFRFTDTLLDEQELQRGSAAAPDKKSDAYKEWRMEREHQALEEMAKRAGFRELKLVQYPDSHPEKEEYNLSHYYIAIKGDSH